MKKAIYTGYEMIDKDFGGLKSGEVTLIGGRPSMGKTSLALQIALNAAKNGESVFFITAENSPIELELRLASIISGTEMNKIRMWDLTDSEWEVFRKTIREVKELPIHFIHTDTMQMIRHCLEENKEVDMIVFDYLQLIHNSITETKDGTLELTSVEFLNEFKKIAKKKKVPVVVLSQLSRRLEKRKDKHPKVGDFRIDNLTEDDFDQAFLLYRDAYYDIDAPKDKAELIGVFPKKGLKETKAISWNYETGIFESKTLE